MGGPMAWGLLILILLVIAAVIVYSGGFFKSTAAGDVDPEGTVDAGRHVRYEVPNGQDPAVVMAALMESGYDCAPDTDTPTPRPVVTIALRDTTTEERERVRALLAETRATNLGGPPAVDTTPVRFLDEGRGTRRPH